MKRLEKKLFYFLFNRWAAHRLKTYCTSNGRWVSTICLAKDFRIIVDRVDRYGK